MRGRVTGKADLGGDVGVRAAAAYAKKRGGLRCLMRMSRQRRVIGHRKAVEVEVSRYYNPTCLSGQRQ